MNQKKCSNKKKIKSVDQIVKDFIDFIRTGSG
jgi:hypothetical protein